LPSLVCIREEECQMMIMMECYLGFVCTLLCCCSSS
jgi:hypothetical protein